MNVAQQQCVCQMQSETRTYLRSIIERPQWIVVVTRIAADSTREPEAEPNLVALKLHVRMRLGIRVNHTQILGLVVRRRRRLDTLRHDVWIWKQILEIVRRWWWFESKPRVAVI